MSKLQEAIQKINRDGGAAKPSLAGDAAAGDQHPRVTSIPGSGDIIASEVLSISSDELQAIGLLPPSEASDLIAEQFREVKRPLIENALYVDPETDRHDNVLIVTSAQPGEGKTFCSFNLALSISRERDIPVLVIDGDILSPKLSHSLGLNDNPGLIDYLESPEKPIDDFIVKIKEYGLLFLPAGQPNVHAHELLASRRMGALVTELSTRHPGIVLFDAPPLLGTNEARVIAKHADQALLVVAAGSTQQSTVLDAAALLDETKPLNVILNKQSGTINRYANYGGYGRK